MPTITNKVIDDLQMGSSRDATKCNNIFTTIDVSIHHTLKQNEI